MRYMRIVNRLACSLTNSRSASVVFWNGIPLSREGSDENVRFANKVRSAAYANERRLLHFTSRKTLRRARPSQANASALFTATRVAASRRRSDFCTKKSRSTGRAHKERPGPGAGGRRCSPLAPRRFPTRARSTPGTCRRSAGSRRRTGAPCRGCTGRGDRP
jgi:hypothetical protein